MLNNNIQDLDLFAALFKALGHPRRLAIYLRLMECGPAGSGCGEEVEEVRCVGDLGAALGIAPSTVSHHIKELRQSGLLRVERQGQRVGCWIDQAVVRSLVEFLQPPVHS